MSGRARIIVVGGATASRKSELALGLAEALGGELVCCDSVQVYRGFRIGSAAPTDAELARAPHHLYGVLEPQDAPDAGRYARLADDVIADIASRGRAPIVVGGTGLYLRALLVGLAPIPAVPAEVRARLRAELEASGIAPLFERLSSVDPAIAGRIEGGARNTQRVLRALEVFEATGQRLSALQDNHQSEPRYAATILAPSFTRPHLAERIAERVRWMLRSGWIDEVRSLLDAGVPPDCRPMQALGYRQLVRYLQGELDLAAAEVAIAAGHRRYAKRQETWFKRTPGCHRLDAAADDLVGRALAVLADQRALSDQK